MQISVNDISFAYPNGVSALSGLSLEIGAGERVAIIGQNGSGKTTLVRQFNGLLRPSSGIVYVGDWDTRQHTPARLATRVSLVFQNPDEQIFKQKVVEEIAFGPRNLRLSENEVEMRVSKALERTGLAELRLTHPYELLPSQRKWVAVASALAMETPVLVLDEPTTGQDAWGLARLGSLIEDLAGEGRTVITVTHDIDFCAEHFERVLLMGKGRILLDGPARDMLSRGDMLAESFVEAPQITRLAMALGYSRPVMTVGEFVEELAKH